MNFLDFLAILVLCTGLAFFLGYTLGVGWFCSRIVVVHDDSLINPEDNL